MSVCKHFLPFYFLLKKLAFILMFIQEVPEGTKESAGGPWQFIGLMPLFDPPRHDSAETIRRALNLGVNVKMITGVWLQFSDLSRVITLILSKNHCDFLFRHQAD